MEMWGCLEVFIHWPSIKLVTVSTMDFLSSGNAAWKMGQILQFLPVRSMQLHANNPDQGYESDKFVLL